MRLGFSGAQPAFSSSFSSSTHLFEDPVSIKIKLSPFYEITVTLPNLKPILIVRVFISCDMFFSLMLIHFCAAISSTVAYGWEYRSFSAVYVLKVRVDLI